MRFRRPLLALSMLASLLTVVPLAPSATAAAADNCISATNAAGVITGRTYGTGNTTFTITPLHGKIFYVDLKNNINAAYIGFKVTTGSGKSFTDAWIKLSDFGATPNVKLVNDADTSMQLGPIGTSGSSVVYFYMKAAAVTSVAQKFDVTLYDGRPDSGVTAAGACFNQVTRVDQTIAANSNKVTSITVNTDTPFLGDAVIVTVNGVTGQPGAGDSTGDKDVMWLSPASENTWPTYSLRLESVSLCLKKNSNSCTTTVNDSLIVYEVNKSGTGFTNKTTYTATYQFRVTAKATFDPAISPTAQIASGTQMKHTATRPNITIKMSSVETASFFASKEAATTLTSSTYCAGLSPARAAVRYTIKATLKGQATAGTVDELTDNPSLGVTLDSSSVRITDTTRSNATLSTTKIVTETLAGGALRYHFVGPFSASVATPVSLSYTMCLTWNTSSSNKGYALIGPTLVGYTSDTVCAVSVNPGPSGSTTATVSPNCYAAPPKLAQSISFDALGTVGVGDQVTLQATATSGLPVSFATSSTRCSVSQGATSWTVTASASTDASNLCTVTASQAGNTTYEAATSVNQNMTIQAGQRIVLTPSTLANMNVSTAQDFTAVSVRSSDGTTATGLAVTVTSITTTVCTVASTGAANTFRISATTQVGTCYLVLSSAAGTGTGSIAYAAAANVEPSLLVGSTQAIDFPQPGDQSSTTAPGTTFVITGTSKSPDVNGTATNLTIDFNSSTPDICTVGTEGISSGVTSVTVTKVKAGYCTLIASQVGNATYSPATDVVRSLNIGSPQTITFGTLTDEDYQTSTKNISASTNSGLNITFTPANTNDCTVGSYTYAGGTTSAVVTRVAYNTCILTASQSGNASWWAASSVTQSFTFNGSTAQTITFNQPTTPINISGSVFSAPATASSGLPIAYSSNDQSICTITSSGTVTMLRVGSCVLNADQDGNRTYAKATRVTRTIVIQATPTIGFTTSNKTITDGSATMTSTHTYSVPSTSENIATGLTITYSSNSLSVCTVVGSTVTLVTTGTCSITASNSGSGNFLASTSVTSTFTIGTASQTITFTQPTDVTYISGGSRNITASTTSKLLISFSSSTLTVCTVATGSVDAAGVTTVTLSYQKAGDCTLTASQAGNAQYSAAVNVIQTFKINKASQTITFGSPGAFTYGDTLNISGQATASSGLTVSYSVSGGCTISSTNITANDATTGNNSCSITASQAGDDNYSAATSVTNIVAVNKHTIVLTANAASKKTTQSDPPLSYNITSGGLKFSDAFSGSITRSGGGSNAAGVYKVQQGTLAINGNYTIVFNEADFTISDKDIPNLTWSDPSAITYGTAITDSTHLNASANFNGSAVLGSKSYTYRKDGLDVSVKDGDKLEAGTYTFKVSFSPSDNANYEATTKTVTVVVNKKAISTVVSTTTRVYNGSNSFTPSFTDLSGVEDGDTITVETAAFTVTSSSADVGTYAAATVGLSASSPGIAGTKKANYTLSYNSTAAAEITVKALTLTITSTSKEYDGTDAAPISYSITGKAVDSDDVSIDGANIGTKYDSAAADSSKTITLTVSSGNGLAGSKKGNYSVIIPATVSGAITKKSVTVSATATNKEYDGTATASISVSGLNGVLAGDLADVSADSIVGSFTNVNVGTRTVSLSASSGTGLAGAKAGNYQLGSSSTTAQITERDITLTADNKTITAGQSTPSFTWTLSKSGGATPLAAGASITGITKTFVFSDSSTSSTAPTTAGTYTIVPSAALFGGDNSNNYRVNYVNGTYRINPSNKTPQNLTITDPGVKTYGDPDFDLTATTDATGLTVTLSHVTGPCVLTGNTITMTGAGQCEIKGDQGGNDTYDAASTTRYITINKKMLNFNAVTAQDKEYDGARTATLGGSNTFTGKVGSDDVDLDSASGLFSSADVGESKSVSISFTLKGAKKDFYDAAFAAITAKITKRTLTVTATVTDKEYDGTTSASVVYSALDRKVAGDDISLKTSDFTTAFDTADAGTGKSVTITRAGGSSGLQGAKKDNYDLNAIASPTGRITAKATTVTLANKSKVEGENDPALTFTSSGFIGADAPTCTTSRGGTNAVGTYAITATCTSSSNYTVTVVNGTFTIRAKETTPPPTDPEPEPEPRPNPPVVTPPTPPVTPPTPPKPEKEKTNAQAKTKVDTPVDVVVKGVDPGAKIVLTDEVRNVPKDVKIDVNPTSGKLEVTPSNNWTGKFTVPVLTEKDGKQVEIETLIVVNPSEPEKAKSDVKALRETIVSWSPTPGAIRYDVDMDGKRACSTTATSCKVNDIVGPKTNIEVTAVGNDDTKSEPKKSPYVAEKPFTINTLPFAVNKAVLTTASKQDLNKTVAIIKEKGFTKMVIDGHTDATNPKVNAALSKARAEAVVKYLQKELPEVKFSLTGYAAKQPVATNKTTAGKAANRRAEIKLW